jgi:hypothetical protein
MNSRLMCMRAVLALSPGPAVHAADTATRTPQEPWSFAPKPLKGEYQVYGGSLSEVQPPTPKDRKVAFMFKGPLAQELFDQIGPDLKLACGTTLGMRQRGDVDCSYDKDQPASPYTCHFGLDLRNGKSIAGSTC